MPKKNTDTTFPGFWGIIGIIACSSLLGAYLSQGLVFILHYLWQSRWLTSLIPLIAAYVSHLLGVFFCLYAYSVNNQKSISENWSRLVQPTLVFTPRLVPYSIVVVLSIVALEIFTVGIGLFI